MKTKLTLSIDDKVLPGARRCARRRGRSLSAMVEEYFRSVDREEEIPFGDKWLGKFRLSEKNTPRYHYLVKKYVDRSHRY